MKRSPEIVNILRGGIEEMVSSDHRPEVNFTRFFNFDENRVTLKIEMANEQGDFVPLGRIDVIELPLDNGRSSCDCTLTEFESGRKERIILRLRDSADREKECQKVFNFFRRIFGKEVTETQSENKQEPILDDETEEDTGFQMDPTRGAQP
jgi:hypothetical protein